MAGDESPHRYHVRIIVSFKKCNSPTRRNPTYILTCKLRNTERPLVYAACQIDDVEFVDMIEFDLSFTSLGDAKMRIKNVVIFVVC